MRIALDATYSVDPFPSGIAVYSRELMGGLAALHETDQFIQCYRPKQWFRRSPSSFPNVRTRILQRPFSIGRPHVFHALNQRVDWRPAAKVVTTFHDLFVLTAEYSTPEFRARFAEQAQQAADRSDLIIAVSAFTARQVQQHLGVPAAKIHVIPHGVHNLIVQMDVPREKVILFVGTLQRRKNIIRLVKAFEQLNKDWRLVLAGAPGGYGSVEIMAYIDRSSCRDRIGVAGYLSNEALERQYARSSVFAFPSLDEGFGIPVLEAMAHGLPVLTSDRSALKEVAGDAALLIDPEDVEAITEGLRKLTADEALRASLAQQGRRRAGDFTWGNTVRSTYELYRLLARTS